MLPFAVLLAAAMLGGPPDDHPGTTEVIAELNRHREAAHLPILVESARLDAAALQRADDMDVRDYFSHVNPDGQTVFDLLEESGYHFMAAGENIALAPELTMAEHGLWMSPDHRANILGPRYQRIGVAVVHRENGEIYVVEVFSD